MESRILGSGGWMPTDARETTCIYFRDDGHVLIVDGGAGLRRLATQPECEIGAGGLAAEGIATVVCTDTEYDDENAAFARGARVLCHDAFFAPGSKGHASARSGACSRRPRSVATA